MVVVADTTWLLDRRRNKDLNWKFDLLRLVLTSNDEDDDDGGGSGGDKGETATGLCLCLASLSMLVMRCIHFS